MFRSTNNYIKRSTLGFTYIEAIISITVILVIGSAVTFGVSKAIRTHKSIKLKESAFRELKKYTDEYRTMVAFGEVPFPGKQPQNGVEVELYNPTKEMINSNFGNQENVIYGYMYHMITNITSGEQSGFFNIKTWILWDEEYIGGLVTKNLAFEVNQPLLRNNAGDDFD